MGRSIVSKALVLLLHNFFFTYKVMVGVARHGQDWFKFFKALVLGALTSWIQCYKLVVLV